MNERFGQQEGFLCFFPTGLQNIAWIPELCSLTIFGFIHRAIAQTG